MSKPKRKGKAKSRKRKPIRPKGSKSTLPLESIMAPDPHKGGRPSEYTPEIADTICAALAEGLSLRTVCTAADMPDRSTVFRWLRTIDQFRDQYARAKEESADADADDLKDIADDGTNDWMERFGSHGEAIGWQVNGEAIQRSRLRVEARKWLASKHRPKKYGDRIDTALMNPDGSPIQVTPVVNVSITRGT